MDEQRVKVLPAFGCPFRKDMDAMLSAMLIGGRPLIVSVGALCLAHLGFSERGLCSAEHGGNTEPYTWKVRWHLAACCTGTHHLRLAVQGVEATLFATLMSVLNGGAFVGTALGSALTAAFGVTASDFHLLAPLVAVRLLSAAKL